MLKWRLKYAVPIEDGKPTTYEEWFEALAEETGKTPPPLLDRPDLFHELTFIYKGFWELDASRPVLQGPGPIPYGEVTEWLNEQGIYGDTRALVRYLLMEADRAYLEHRMEQANKERERQEKRQEKQKRRRR